MNLTVITEPPFEPVTMARVYQHLRLTPDHAGSPDETSHPHDDLLRSYIKTAREFVEIATRRALVQQRLRLSGGSFPSYCAGWSSHNRWRGIGWQPYEHLRLFRPPLIRVERVYFFDSDNASQEIDPADYYVTDDLVPELRFASGYAPLAIYDRPDALRVEYVAGYAPSGSPSTTQEDFTGNVPDSLKNAVLLGVQLLYDNPPPADREALERMRESMLQNFRIQHTP